MPRMFHRPMAGERKVFLATPCYGGLSAGYAFALFASSAALSKTGMVAELAIYSGNCHVDDSRNILVADFLAGDCTDLVFLDADLRWEPEDLVKLCQYDRDVVAATYPYKQEETGFPIRYSGPLWTEPDGCFEVAGVPTGFLRIRRSVLELLASQAEKFKPKSGDRLIPLIFERLVHNGCRIGGDYAFCHKWKQAGGKIYVDPEIEIEHTGDKHWNGSLGHHLRVEMMGAVKAGITEIQAKAEKPQTFRDMVLEWGNYWACDAAMLNTITILARESTKQILDVGSGLSTLCMAAANPNVTVYALEHDQEWYKRVTDAAKELGLNNVSVRLSPLDRGWYAVESVPNGPFSMVINDGPPRNLGNRASLYAFGDRFKDAVLVVDDIDEPDFERTLKNFTESHGRKYTIVGRDRKFAVSSPKGN